MAVNSDTGSSKIQHNNFEAFRNVESTSNTLAEQTGDKSMAPNDYWFGSYGIQYQGLNVTYKQFAGFDENNRDKFNSAIDTYIKNVNNILEGFNQKENVLADAFKGTVADSLKTFFDNIKKICQSYVNAIAEEKNMVLEAENNWLAATKSIGSAIDSDSSVKAVDSVVINN